MKKNTPSWVFEGWKAYWRAKPFGDDWWQAGVIAGAALAPHTKKKVTPADFIPMQKPNIGLTTADEMEAALKAVAGVK